MGGTRAVTTLSDLGRLIRAKINGHAPRDAVDIMCFAEEWGAWADAIDTIRAAIAKMEQR